MITVGEYLQSGRNKKRLTIEQVEKATKIRAKFLDALEKNQFDKLPDQTFTKGFIRNYATFLGLSATDAMAFYRRQVDEGKARHLPTRGFQPLVKRFKLTPQLFTGTIVAVFLVLFFAYLGFSYFAFAGAPALNVKTPQNNSVVTKEVVKVSGTSDPDATLTINSQPVLISENGTFSVDIPLQSGLNTLTISAKNKYQKETTIIKNIRLEK